MNPNDTDAAIFNFARRVAVFLGSRAAAVQQCGSAAAEPSSDLRIMVSFPLSFYSLRCCLRRAFRPFLTEEVTPVTRPPLVSIPQAA